MYRARFSRDIVAEFWPPSDAPSRRGQGEPTSGRRRGEAPATAGPACRRQRLILLCDGMPAVPRKQPLASFLAGKGFWVIYPRWRGSWESAGDLLARPPQQDLSDILDALPRGIRELAFGQRFTLAPDEVYVIGGSFGGTAALLASLDPRVHRVIANCPVVDWSILDEEQGRETSNPSYPAYIRAAFGNGYRLSARNWNRLRNGKFFSPVHEATRLDPSKILIFHAKDDPYIPWRGVHKFAARTRIPLRLFARGGHLSTAKLVPERWPEISRFLRSS